MNFVDKRQTVDRAVKIGVDIGAAKTLACVFSANSRELLECSLMPTPVGDGGRAVLDRTVEMVDDLCTRATGPMESISIALPELVDRAGKPASADLFDWRNLPIAEAFGVGPAVYVECGVRSAAYAESQQSQFSTYDPFLFVSWSATIGHTLVIGGEPYAGARGFATKFATGDLVTDCWACSEITPFILDKSASGQALGDRYSQLKSTTGLTSRQVFEARNHDPQARAMISRAMASMASFLGQLVNTLDPACLVIGGCIGSLPWVFDELQIRVRDHIWAEPARSLPIRPSGLGCRAAVTGAVLLADRQALAAA